MYADQFEKIVKQYGKGIFQVVKGIVEMSLVNGTYVSGEETDSVFIKEWWMLCHLLVSCICMVIIIGNGCRLIGMTI